MASRVGSPVLASPVAPPISGIVTHLESPIAGALVILYNLGERWDELFALYDEAIVRAAESTVRLELLGTKGSPRSSASAPPRDS